MPSSPLGSTHGRQRREWHDITAFGKHTRSDNVRHGMTSPPLGKTHGWQRQAWHDNTAFGQHTWSKNVGRGMPSSPLGSTHGRTTLGVACHHRLWTTHTVEGRRACHAIIALEPQTRLNDVRRGMTSSPFERTYDRTMPGVTCHHCF